MLFRSKMFQYKFKQYFEAFVKTISINLCMIHKLQLLCSNKEFPPKIYGGLAVASYGITKGLSLQGDVETTFCMPKPTGEEEDFLKIVGMNQVPIVWRDVDYNYLKSRLTRNMTPEDYYSFRDHIYSDFSYMQYQYSSFPLACMVCKRESIKRILTVIMCFICSAAHAAHGKHPYTDQQ